MRKCAIFEHNKAEKNRAAFCAYELIYVKGGVRRRKPTRLHLGETSSINVSDEFIQRSNRE